MKHLGALLLLVAISSPLAAADLTNSDIIKMVAAGLSESTILQTIDGAQSTNFDTTADGLIALKKGGASDAIIQRILARPAIVPPPGAAPAASGSAPCRFDAPEFDTLVMRADGQLLPMTYLTASVDRKKGGLVANAFSFGIAKVKVKTLLRINKEQSSLRIHDRQPQLLDLFTPVGSSPENIYVVRLTPDDGARFLQVGATEANSMGTASTTLLFPDGIRVEMTAETVASQCLHEGNKVSVYRLKPATPLADGEYAVMATTSRFYDFGVDGSK